METENPKTLANVRNPLNDLQTPNGLPTLSDSRQWMKSPEGRLYLAEMMDAVNLTLAEANMPPLTESELGTRAMHWAEVLSPIIPLARVRDSLNRAFADHRSVFPVNAHEIKFAWEKIVEEELRAWNEHVATQINAVETCKYKSQHRIDGFNQDDAMVEYRDPLDASGWVTWPCYECRKSAFEQRLADHKAKHPELTIKPGELANTLVADTIAAQARAARDAAAKWRVLAILVDADQDPTITFAGRRKLKAIRDYIADPEAYAEAKRRKLELVGSV